VRTKGRNRRGTANAVPSADGKQVGGFYEDDNVSLEELIRREKIEGVQDYDSNFTEHILKKGSKFRTLHEDDDEAYALGWYEHASKKMDGSKRDQKRHQKEVADKQRIQVNLEQCTRCMESKKFGRQDAVVSVSPHAYLCIEGFNQCIVPGQMFIAPQEHQSSCVELDESVWTEIRNYQKCLVRFFEAEQPPRTVIFVETSVHRVSRDKALLGAGPHMAIAAYPIDMEMLPEARAYWKKAFEEAECEFTVQHKKVITTDAKSGVRGAVPKGFTYVHVDFCLGGGFAHIVEDTHEFPRDFAQHTIAGMCELTILDRAYTSKEEYRDACRDLKKRFSDGYDWAQVLKS